MLARTELIQELAGRIRQLERSRHRSTCDDEIAPERPSPALGTLLSKVEWPKGGLVEWLSDGCGSGAISLSLLALPDGLRNQLAVVIDEQNQFYAPAAMALGLNNASTVLIRTDRSHDALWSAEQALRTPGIGLVLCRVDKLSQRACRRLQLAAEVGGGLGLLFRPERVRHEPCWAVYRFLVRPIGASVGFRSAKARTVDLADEEERAFAERKPTLPRRRLHVELLRARRGFSTSVSHSTIVELDDADGRVCLASELAPTAPEVRAAGA